MPTSINPFAADPNSFFCSQGDTAYVTVYETLYMFNPLDGQLYGLLADGEPVWNDDRTEITIKIKAAAHWSDGTDVTAHDVAHTWATHVKYQTSPGIDFAQYIANIEAVDDDTVVIKANMDNYNPLKMLEYIPKYFVTQKAYIEAKEAEVNGDAEAFKTLEMWDAPHTGPYTYVYSGENEHAVRDDNYWGQDASMWGKLPVPKYLAHNDYAGNDVSAVAFENGEIDCNQQFAASLWTLWEDKGLPISTYIDEAPYFLNLSMPTIWFNMKKEGLDQLEVRKAIALAIDYDQIIASAMSGYSYTFQQAPRCLFNPTDGERRYYNADVLGELNFAGKEYDKANKLLDDAGIVDNDGDGIREYNGKNLSFEATCPKGWSDWNAALEIVCAAGKEIGIELVTNFPEAAQYTENNQIGNYDITMATMAGSSISNPWLRHYQTLYGWGGVENFPARNTFNFSFFYNEECDDILMKIPTETDEAKLLEYYTELNKIYLENVPSVALMYRPGNFHEVNESVWGGWPEMNDGTNVPPVNNVGGYAIAGLYNMYLIEE